MKERKRNRDRLSLRTVTKHVAVALIAFALAAQAQADDSDLLAIEGTKLRQRTQQSLDAAAFLKYFQTVQLNNDKFEDTVSLLAATYPEALQDKAVQTAVAVKQTLRNYYLEALRQGGADEYYKAVEEAAAAADEKANAQIEVVLVNTRADLVELSGQRELLLNKMQDARRNAAAKQANADQQGRAGEEDRQQAWRLAQQRENARTEEDDLQKARRIAQQREQALRLDRQSEQAKSEAERRTRDAVERAVEEARREERNNVRARATGGAVINSSSFSREFNDAATQERINGAVEAARREERNNERARANGGAIMHSSTNAFDPGR